MRVLVVLTVPDSYVEQIQRRIDFCEWVRTRIKSNLGISNTEIAVSLEKPKGRSKTKEDNHAR